MKNESAKIASFLLFGKNVERMVLILDGNLGHVAHAWRKIGLFGEKKTSDLCCPWYNQMP